MAGPEFIPGAAGDEAAEAAVRQMAIEEAERRAAAAAARAAAAEAAEATALTAAEIEGAEAGAGLLASIGPVGWVILGVAVVGVGAYLIYKANESAEEKFPNTSPSSTQPCPSQQAASDKLEDKVPGKPTAEDGYVPPKRGPGADGAPVKNPNGPGRGWVDENGDVWVPTGPGPTAHGGPHWDVQTPGGGHRNVYPGGRVRK